MPLHRKIGGIHWFALGRLRISVCLTAGEAHTKREPRPKRSNYPSIAMGISQGAREAVVCKPIKLPHTTAFPRPPETMG